MSTSYSPSISYDGLVMYLDAGNVNSYIGTGTTWNDLSGRSYSGSLVNDPTYTSANKGRFVFDGVNDHVSLSTIPDSFWQGNWSVVFWANWAVVNSGDFSFDRPLIQHGFNEQRKGLHLTNRYGALHYGLYNDDTVGSTQLVANTWYHVVFTLNNSTYARQALLNGNYENLSLPTAGGPYTGTGTNTSVGAGMLFGSYFNGSIASIQFYNRVLSQAEVRMNYNSTKGRFGL